MDLGLLQREAAAQIGVALDTYRFWEGSGTQPRARHWPGIIRFLGYDPIPEGIDRRHVLRDERKWCLTPAALQNGQGAQGSSS
ncbi:MAG: hypothetical protein EHM91_11540 [Planctomycetota bacterium]|nr:MAG: hypothetical protein EHM91_11540 [Planctomycetota bacterium]